MHPLNYCTERFEHRFRAMPLVFIVLAFCMGIFAALKYNSILILLILFSLSLLGLIFWKRSQGMALLILIAIFFAGWFYHSLELHKINSVMVSCDSFEGNEVIFRGKIKRSVPAKKGQRITLSPTIIYNGKNESIREAGVFIYTKSDTTFTGGDTLSGRGLFSSIRGKRNPGFFDFKSFYAKQGIFGNIYEKEIYELLPGKRGRLIALIENTRYWIRDCFTKYLGESSGLITALILGDKSQVAPDVKRHFVDTGVIHVLAVSGLHVGYVLVILLGMVKIFRIPWGWNKLIVFFGLLFFAALTGGKPSVIRAVIMAGLYLFASFANRPANLWNIIALAGFILLCYQPGYITDLGFLFSFSAVISIVLFYNLFQKILPENLRVNTIRSTLLKWIWGLFLVSLSAQIGTLPLTASYFHRIPLISLVANVLIVPLVGGLVAVGFSLLFLGWIPGVGYLIGQAGWGLTHIIQGLAYLFSSFPFAYMEISGVTLRGILIYFLGVTAFFLILQRGYRAKAIISFLFAINMALWPKALKMPTLDVIFMDVGQGDATLIKFPDNKTMLIDAGQRNFREDYGKDVVLPVLSHFGVNQLTWVVMSHPHSDHIGGLVSVIKTIPVDTVWDTHIDYGSWTYQHLKKRFSENGSTIKHVQKGEVYALDNGAVIQIIAPDTAFVKETSIINNSSIVMKLSYGETEILFTGDLEEEGDSFLLTLSNHLDSDVLKVAHHGSITSSTTPVIEAVSPEIAIVSVGKNNKFRHPSNVVLDRFMTRNIKIHRTDKSGALWIKSDGKTYWEEKWK